MVYLIVIYDFLLYFIKNIFEKDTFFETYRVDFAFYQCVCRNETNPFVIQSCHYVCFKDNIFQGKFLLPTLFHFYWYLEFILRKIAWKSWIGFCYLFETKYFLWNIFWPLNINSFLLSFLCRQLTSKQKDLKESKMNFLYLFIFLYHLLYFYECICLYYDKKTDLKF